MRTIETGIGATLDAARKGLPGVVRTYSLGVNKEGARLPLARGVGLAELRQGHVCSLAENGTIKAFDPSLPFAGFVQTLHQDLEVMAVLDKRGAVLLRVAGLTRDTKLGTEVYATGENHFSLESGVVIGQLLGIESFEQSLAIVGFKRADDPRPFSMNGRLMERERR